MKTKSLLLIAVIFLGLTTVAMAQNEQNYNSAKTNSELSFTENKGQIHDQNYNPRPDVLFAGGDGNFAFHLKNNGISYQLNRIDTWKKEEDLSTKKAGFENAEDQTKLVADQTTIYRLDLNWLNANNNADVIKQNPLDGFNNYFLENCPNGALNVKSYQQITYQNIFNGIDLKWYQKEGALEYDYIVSAGADYKQIQIEINGADKIILNNKGELVLKTPLGDIVEQVPVVKQNGKTLKSKWVIKNEILSFEIENINKNEAFVIDPVVRTWGTYYGDSLSDVGYSCATDASGNVYLAGYSNSTSGIATTGAHQTVYGGGSYDAFLVKFNSSGVRQWGTYYGGSEDDYGRYCTTDASGNVYLAGYTASNSGIATTGAHQTVFGGLYDAYLIKFNSSGIRQWGTYYGGTGNDYGFSCTTDASGNVYIAGRTTSNGIATVGAHQTVIGGAYDAFLVKFNSSGVRQWGTYYGDSGNDEGYSCTTDGSGNVYMVGFTASNSGIATIGAHQTVYGSGTRDAFLVKFNSSGARQWGTYYGGSSSDIGYSCTTDALGNVCLAGYTASISNIATVGPHQTVYGGGAWDAFLVKFNSSGVRQWGTYYGGNQYDYGLYCTTNSSSNISLAGYTNSNSDIATAGSHQTVLGGNYDAFLVQFDANGARQWGTYYGGSGDDYGRACTIDITGYLYMAGYTISSTNIASSGSHQSSFGGGIQDAFLVKFVDCVNINITTTTSMPTICFGASTTITASGATTYTWMPGNLTGATVTVSPTTTTTYTVTGTSANGCLNTATRTITVNPLPIVTTTSTAPSICIGGSTTLAANGASSYNWMPGNLSGFLVPVSPTTTTTYTVTGTNANACVNTATITVTVNPSPVVTTTTTAASICIGASTIITASGATVYTWMPGNLTGATVTVSPISTTTYTVTGTNASGCTNTAIITITVNLLPVVTTSTTAASICIGASTIITASGAATYSWMPGNLTGATVTVSPIATTTYTVTGTTNGCSVTTTGTITVNPLPTVTANSSAVAVCAGGGVTLTGGGASTYTWDNNVTNGVSFVPTATATYMVTGIDANGCSNMAMITVSVNALPTVTATSSSASVCAGGSVTLTGGGASTYAWDNNVTNGVSFVPTATATYMVTGIDANGCSNMAMITVSVNALPTVTATSSSASVCAGGSVTLTGGGASTYAWDNNVTNGVSFVPTATTTYMVTGTDSLGCSNTAMVIVTVNALPTVTAIAVPIVVCVGDSTTLIGGGATTYMWDNNVMDGVSFAPTATTTYIVTGTDSLGCSNTTMLMVSVNALPTVTATSSSASVCAGDSVTLTGGGTNMYMWDNNVMDGVSFAPTATTTYIVTGTDSLGCSNTAMLMVSVNALPVVSATASSSVVCVDDTLVTLTGTPTGGVWSGAGVSGTSFSPTTAGVGTQIATYSYQDSLGCEGTASVSIQVNECVGFNEIRNENLFTIFPNPTQSVINVKADASLAGSTYIVYDNTGKVVLSGKINAENTSIELENLSVGIYLFSVGENLKQTFKVIKE